MKSNFIALRKNSERRLKKSMPITFISAIFISAPIIIVLELQNLPRAISHFRISDFGHIDNLIFLGTAKGKYGMILYISVSR